MLPIDLETGQLGEPEPLGYADLAGRTLEACTDDVVGWVVRHVARPARGAPSTSGRKARGLDALASTCACALTTTRACIERIAGMYDGQSAERAAQLTRGGVARRRRRAPLKPGELIATPFAAQSRYALAAVAK